MKGYCQICDTPIEIHLCCTGRDCGCVGLPTEPPVCSNECFEKYMEIIHNSREPVKIDIDEI